MRVRFEEEEYFVMAMFEKDSRIGTMEEIRRVLPFISEDGELDLETYAQEPAEEA